MAEFDPNQSSLAACLERIDSFRRKNKLGTQSILTSKDIDIWKEEALHVSNIPGGFNKAIMPFYTDGPATFYVSAAGPGVKVPKHSHKEGAGIRFIVSGSIFWGGHELSEGDWMHMPAGAEYEFVVGPRGVSIFYCYQCCCA
jgi:redox-sensitive bicupin YhaK (pirin superfamily)